jgi:hypothetical protein
MKTFEFYPVGRSMEYTTDSPELVEEWNFINSWVDPEVRGVESREVIIIVMVIVIIIHLLGLAPEGYLLHRTTARSAASRGDAVKYLYGIRLSRCAIERR